MHIVRAHEGEFSSEHKSITEILVRSRQTVWIVRAQGLAKKVCHDCFHCKRTRRKLLEAHSWYKDKIVVEEERKEAESFSDDKERSFFTSTGNWRKGSELKKRNKEKLKELIDAGIEKVNCLGEKIQGFIFVQHTVHSTLAKRVREGLKLLEKVGSFKIKIVERTGDTLVDLLHRCNAWKNEDCKRQDCIVCSSTEYGSKLGSCRQRNVTYETFCITCERKERKKRQNSDSSNDQQVIGVVLDDLVGKESPLESLEKETIEQAITKFLNSPELCSALNGSSEFNSLSSVDENAPLLLQNSDSEKIIMGSNEINLMSSADEFNLPSSADETTPLPPDRIKECTEEEDLSLIHI